MKIVERDRFLREIFRLVLVEGPISRGELMDRLEISRASVTRFAAPLIERGMIGEAHAAENGTRGRPSRPLQVNASARTFVGVKLAGTTLSSVRTDLKANSLEAHEAEIGDSAPERVVEQIVASVKRLAPADDITAVGISLGGLVTPDGVVVHEDFLRWDGVPLAKMVQSRVRHPVVLENDVVALATAEQWFGAGRGIDSFALLTVGAGVGYGLVVKDRVVDTQRAREGLIGHLPLWEEGPRCSLGHAGCATALLAAPYLLRGLQSADRSIGSLDAAYASNDPRVREVLVRAGTALGRVLAEIGSIAMVDRIIISGEGAGLFDSATDAVHGALRRYSPARIPPPDVVIDRRGFDLWARGAAAVAIQHTVLTTSA